MRRRKPPPSGGSCHGKAGTERGHRNTQKSVIANQPAGWCGNPADLPGVPSAAPAPKAPSGRGGCHAKHDWGRRGLFASRADWGEIPAAAESLPLRGRCPSAPTGAERAGMHQNLPSPQNRSPRPSRGGAFYFTADQTRAPTAPAPAPYSPRCTPARRCQKTAPRCR